MPKHDKLKQAERINMPRNKVVKHAGKLNMPKHDKIKQAERINMRKLDAVSTSALLSAAQEQSSPACRTSTDATTTKKKTSTLPEMCMEITEAERINMPKKKMVKHAGK